MRILKVLIPALALGVFVSACCSPCRKAKSMGVASFVGTEWKLVQWDSEIIPETGMNTYTILFTPDGKVTGFGDCNRFSGSYDFTTTSKTNKLNIGQLASTRMACPNLAKENAYFEALKNVERFNRDGDILVLSSPGRLVFEKKK